MGLPFFESITLRQTKASLGSLWFIWLTMNLDIINLPNKHIRFCVAEINPVSVLHTNRYRRECHGESPQSRH